MELGKHYKEHEALGFPTEETDLTPYVKRTANTEADHTIRRVNNAGGDTILFDARSYNAGDATWVAGKLNNALQFNGTSDYVSFTDDAIFKPTEFTIFVWVKTTINDPVNAGVIFSSSNQTTYSNGITLGIYQENIWFRLGNNAGTDYNQYVPVTGINDGNWHLIIAKYVGNAVTIKVDNVVKFSDTYNTGIVYDGTNLVSIGARSLPSGNDNLFVGDIDEFQLYNRGTTDGEDTTLYNSGNGTETPLTGIQVGYHFNETTGITVSDFVGDKDGSVQGIPSGSNETDVSVFNSGGNVANIKVTGQYKTTIADGTKPFVTDSTTLNDNFNADLWDGYHHGFSNYKTISESTLLDETYEIIECNSELTVTLPSASGITGKKYNIIRTGTGDITITPDGSETISGDSNLILTSQWDSVVIYSNGTNWIRGS